ncbi:MAG: hypothetical protein LH660_16570, partial [Phormidesmis sp. CAN_BIN36]|nr:hypothetical protein [Phormidesmis sp. CAN_BIN36]
ATVKNLTSTGTRIGLAPTSAPPGGGFRYDFTAAASVSWVSVGPSSNLQFGHGASGNNSSGLWNSGGSLALQFDVTANTNQGSVLIGTATNNGADKLQVAGNASVAGNFTASGTSHTIGANTNTSTFLGLNGAAGSTRQMLWRTAGLNRWNLYADIGTEAGSNTGSLMTLSYYNDAGGYIGDIFTATRLGVFTFTAPTARFTGANLGFFNATPAAKPTVTGSKGGNAALASLITALATLGLVTDTTT